jgi:hypothetical protein
MSKGRFGELFGESPKSTQWQHLEIIDYGVHKIEGEILLALFDVPEMEHITAHAGRDCGLRLTLPHSQFRDRQSEDLSWRIRSSWFVCPNRFGHTVIVATTFALKQQL